MPFASSRNEPAARASCESVEQMSAPFEMGCFAHSNGKGSLSETSSDILSRSVA